MYCHHLKNIRQWAKSKAMWKSLGDSGIEYLVKRGVPQEVVDCFLFHLVESKKYKNYINPKEHYRQLLLCREAEVVIHQTFQPGEHEYSDPKKRMNIPEYVKSFLGERDGWRCGRPNSIKGCGCDLSQWKQEDGSGMMWLKKSYGHVHADHIIPKSKGGHCGIDNLQLLCHNCNSWWGKKAQEDVCLKNMPRERAIHHRLKYEASSVYCNKCDTYFERQNGESLWSLEIVCPQSR